MHRFSAFMTTTSKSNMALPMAITNQLHPLHANLDDSPHPHTHGLKFNISRDILPYAAHRENQQIYIARAAAGPKRDTLSTDRRVEPGLNWNPQNHTFQPPRTYFLRSLATALPKVQHYLRKQVGPKRGRQLSNLGLERSEAMNAVGSPDDGLTRSEEAIRAV